jgi:hypothetical protein
VPNRQAKAKPKAGIAPAKLALKRPLRVIGGKGDSAIAAIRKKGTRLC